MVATAPSRGQMSSYRPPSRHLGITDRAYIISEGTVLASGRPDDIINNDAVRQVYLGEHFRL